MTFRSHKLHEKDTALMLMAVITCYSYATNTESDHICHI